MATRISTTSVYQSTIGEFTRLQSSVTKTNRQITSGIAANSYAADEFTGKIITSLSLQSTVSRSKNFQTNNNLVINRLTMMDQSLKQIEQVASDLRRQLVLERSANGGSVPLKAIATDFLDVVADRLNVEIEGRYLFAGSKTNIKPVQDITTSNLSATDPTIATEKYYRGDVVNLTLRVNDELDVAYGVRANDEAFQNLIGALHNAIAADDVNNGGNARLDNSLTMLNEAIDQLATVRNRINNNMLILRDANKVHTDTQTYSQSVLDDTVGVDVSAATIRLSLDQTVLQATFQAFSKISSLNLQDFL